MEIGYKSIRNRESIGRKDELVGPTAIWLYLRLSSYRCFQCPHYCNSYCENLMIPLLCTINPLCSLLRNIHLLRVHLMLGKVLYIYRSEVSEPHMKSQEGSIHTLYLHPFKKFATKMKSGCRSCNRTLILSINGLKALKIYPFRFSSYPFGNRDMAHTEQSTLELVIRTRSEERRVGKECRSRW